MRITFDKLTYLETLKKSGISAEQARAHADALDEALKDVVATKRDLREMELSLKLWSTSLAAITIVALSAIKYFG